MTFLTKNWFWLMIVVVMGLVLLKSCNDNPKLKKQINHLEKLNDSIKQSILVKNQKIEILNKEIGINKEAIDSLSKEKQKVVVERKYISRQVEEFTMSELDSVINSVPKKQAVKSIIDYPHVISELNITNKILNKYKEQVEDLERRDSLRIGIIDSQNEIITNVTKQRDLYEEASKPKNNAFLYIEIPINNLNRFEGGIDYQIRNKLLVGASVDYNNTTKDIGANLKLGIKIF